MDAADQREVTEIAGGKNQEDEADEDIEVMSMNKELPFCRFCWVNETSE